MTATLGASRPVAVAVHRAGVSRRAQVAARCSSQDDGTTCSSRRAALQRLAALTVAVPLLGAPGLARAEEAAAGFDPLRAVLRAPAEFYRSRQQANGGIKILAPIRASRARLQECVDLLEGSPGDYAPVLANVRAASLNCYTYEAEGEAGLEERASLLQQQLSLGDPCTFRILHKNGLTLVTDPAVEAEADESLDALLRSFQLLDDMVERAKQGDGEAARAVPALLQQCISCNLRFESAIATCIGVA